MNTTRAAGAALFLTLCIALPLAADDLGEFQRRRDEIRRRYVEAARRGDLEGKRKALEDLRNLKYTPPAKAPAAADGTIRRSFDFRGGLEGFEPLHVDYPVDQESFFELRTEHRALPPALEGGRKALFLSGVNRSDDLFLGVRRRIEGLRPGATYRMRVAIRIASNAPLDCAGIGGSPGASVHLKAGATTRRPDRRIERGYYRLDADKGNQSSGGRDLRVLGPIGTDRPCPEDTFEPRNLTLVDFDVVAGSDGSAWLVLGTDSGFEGRTDLYVTRVEVELRPVAGGPAPRLDPGLRRRIESRLAAGTGRPLPGAPDVRGLASFVLDDRRPADGPLDIVHVDRASGRFYVESRLESMAGPEASGTAWYGPFDLP